MKKKRDPVSVNITELHPEGYGLADSIHGTLVVPGTLPGESVLVQPVKRRRKQLLANILCLEKASPERILPVCEVADRCGGCSFHHFDPAAQITHKQSQLLRYFDQIRPDQLLPPIQGSDLGYRGKARLGVKYVNKKGRVLVGFREKMGGYITEMSRCEILVPPFNDLIPEFARLVESLSNPTAIPQLEVAAGDDGAAIVIRHLDPLNNDDLDRLRDFSRLFAVHVYLQPGNLDSVHRLYPEEGEERLHYLLTAENVRLGFHPMDFIQVNRDINRQLVSRVMELMAPCKGDNVLDLFCGIGNFSLPLARQAGKVTGIEVSEESVARAKENAEKNEISNVLFKGANLYTEAELLIPLLRDINKVLIDPPRTGAMEVMQKLVKGDVERVVYVSCNPATLARDVQMLCNSGPFHFARLGVVDMFPHTTHVESIACLERK